MSTSQLIGVVLLLALFAFVAFCFRQGMKAHPGEGSQTNEQADTGWWGRWWR